MTDRTITRRTVLQGGAALTGAIALGNWREGEARQSKERPTLIVFWLNGGPAGLFNSADSFLRSGAFGVAESNVRYLGNDLYVDAGSLGALPSAARAHMASINFQHGVIRPHESARAAVLEAGPRSQLLRLAAFMPSGPIRCAVVNDLGFAQPAYTGRPDRQFDTHGDDAGVAARAVMAPIIPSLSLLLDRTLALPGRNVVTMLVGEFSRTIPKSDHEPGGTATVIGKYVKTGTAGPQRADGSPPTDAPPPEGLWAYTSAALRLGAAPFGPNPCPKLIV